MKVVEACRSIFQDPLDWTGLFIRESEANQDRTGQDSAAWTVNATDDVRSQIPDEPPTEGEGVPRPKRLFGSRGQN